MRTHNETLEDVLYRYRYYGLCNVLVVAALILLLAALLVGCSSDGGRITPVEPSGSGWQFAYSTGTNGSCENFDFDGAQIHYCIKQMGLSSGQTLTMRFTLNGNVNLAPVQSDDIPPATVHLFMQRTGDDLSCAGTKQQYRYWTPARVDLVGPGTFTLSAVVAPENWTDCYGESGSAHESEFRNTVNQLAAVGFTFGGQYFYGHGVMGSGHFTLEQFGTGLSHKRKR